MNAAILIVFINDFDTKSLFALKVCFQFFLKRKSTSCASSGSHIRDAAHSPTALHWVPDYTRRNHRLFHGNHAERKPRPIYGERNLAI